MVKLFSCYWEEELDAGSDDNNHPFTVARHLTLEIFEPDVTGFVQISQLH